MSGDVHVRFSESLGVKFPRATHPFAAAHRRAGLRVIVQDVGGMPIRLSGQVFGEFVTAGCRHSGIGSTHPRLSNCEVH